jgi:fibronectin type 3 domain-containing protein
VTSYNLRGRESARSQPVTVMFDEPPPAPTEIRGSVDARGIVLRWDQPARLGGIRSYRIYRGTTPEIEEMKPVGHTRWAETYFVDRDAEKGKTYFYTVRSVKINQGISLESPPSATVKETMLKTDLEQPEKVNTASTTEGIRVYWNPVGSREGETLYNVYRSESGRMFTRINQGPLHNAWFMDKNVTKGKTYTYGVTAFPDGKPGEESSRTASDAVEYMP